MLVFLKNLNFFIKRVNERDFLMCIPDVIATGINAAITVATAVEAANENAKETNLVIKNQITMAERAKADAAYERQEGIEESRKKRLDAIRNMAEIESSVAANGLSTNSQTSLLLYEDEEEEGELDALDILKDSELASKKHMEAYSDYYSQAKLTSLKGKNQYRSTIRSAVASSAKELVKVGAKYIKSKE